MFKCRDCGYIFDEPKKYSEDRTPGGVHEGGSFIEHFTGCPLCAGAYEDTIYCDECMELFGESEVEYVELENGEKKYLCEKCKEELLGEEI